MHPYNTNVFAPNVIEKKDRPDNLHLMCLADFPSTYVSKKADDLPIAPNEIKSSTVPVWNIADVKLILNIIDLKNAVVKCRILLTLRY